jgi:hypothetical protein
MLSMKCISYLTDREVTCHDMAVTTLQSPFLTPKEAGVIRRRSEAALAKERQRGEGPPWVRDGSRVLYPAEAFWDYMENLTGSSEDEGQDPARAPRSLQRSGRVHRSLSRKAGS